MLTDALLRARYRPHSDTAAVQVDLPPHSIVSTVRDHHDLDQVREWAELADGSFVLHAAQILHLSALLDLDQLALPTGAHDALHALRAASASSHDSERSEMTVRCSLDSLSTPSAPESNPPFLPSPIEAEALAAFLAMADGELLAVLREIDACLTDFPGANASGTFANLLRTLDRARANPTQTCSDVLVQLQHAHDASRPGGSRSSPQ